MATGAIFIRATLWATVSFRNDEGGLVDPDEVQFTTRSPSGILTEYENESPSIERTSLGTYRLTFDVTDEAGRWLVRADGKQGAANIPVEGYFDVRSSGFATV